jgi:hypothetical protein
MAKIRDCKIAKLEKSLNIPKGWSEPVYRRTDNTIAKSTKGKTPIYKTYT